MISIKARKRKTTVLVVVRVCVKAESLTVLPTGGPAGGLPNNEYFLLTSVPEIVFCPNISSNDPFVDI